MKLTAAQLRTLEMAARPNKSKHYEGTEGMPSVYLDERSAAALERRGLLSPKRQTWKTRGGHFQTSMFWIVTDAGREALASNH